jgi:hypothetical protein
MQQKARTVANSGLVLQLGSGVRLPRRRHIGAAAIRHFRRHANGYAQRWVRVDGLAVAMRFEAVVKQQFGHTLVAAIDNGTP